MRPARPSVRPSHVESTASGATDGRNLALTLAPGGDEVTGYPQEAWRHTPWVRATLSSCTEYAETRPPRGREMRS